MPPEGYSPSGALHHHHHLQQTLRNNPSGDNSAPNKPDGGDGDNPGPPKLSRKRTKTGCLTCRKRRIKCGEERPTCNNCIKSKRNCDGYNQRVVFKDGMHNIFSQRVLGTANQRFVEPYTPVGPQVLQPIAPAPAPVAVPVPATPVFRTDDSITSVDQSVVSHLNYPEPASARGSIDQSHINVVPLPNSLAPTHRRNSEFQGNTTNYQQQLPSPIYEFHQGKYTPTSITPTSFAIQAAPSDSNTSPFSVQVTPSPESSSATMFGPPLQRPLPPSPSTSDHQYSDPQPHPSFLSQPTSSDNSCPLNAPLDRKYSIASGSVDHSHRFHEDFSHLSDLPESSGVGSCGVGMVNPPLGPTTDYSIRSIPGLDDFELLAKESEIDYDQESEDDEMEDEEDDGEYKYGSQEDGMIMMETTGASGQPTNTRQQISQILEPFSRHLDEHARISLRSFLPDSGALATYHPTLSSSPLMNPITAKIFCHFVYVLGPRLHGPQNVWSYTIPILALSHPPLLHAILALSSLHISKLVNSPSHPSLMHYHIALRRLGKAIASDRHRGHVATLAATLMLAYYETMAAEHDKWSSHIHGAQQLLKEVDFDRVTKRVELLDEEEGQGSSGAFSQPSGYASQQKPPLLAMRRMRRQMIADDVDESLKAYLMGATGRRGSAQRPNKCSTDRPFSKKELEHLKLQADMFWWYAKMDCYQSLLSGCPLILDYIYWGQCPPRARIGTLGTTYGSSDHYFLLLGRLCDFQVRDLKRKRAVQKANGGRWIPPPEMGGPPRGQRPPPMPQKSQFGPGPGVGIPDGVQFGMIPPSAHLGRIPSSFSRGRNEQAPNSGVPEPLAESADLEAATVEAEMEWNEIHKAFIVLQESLGAEYQPLDIDYMPVVSTPFGSAIYYRTYSIATLQMLYNMAMIALHRCHPSMPPVAMMATGIQARKTQQFAVDIARIVAGLVPTVSSAQINPALGASLIESTMPMFFAGVQYEQDDQRDWTIRKLREINRLTGWATASRILLGCQRAWEKSSVLGGKPPYVRPPFEEEEEMFYEYQNYYVSLQTGIKEEEMRETEAGGEGSRFLWKVAGRRTVEAVGILGERGDLGVDRL